jgi:hypothetical protein
MLKRIHLLLSLIVVLILSACASDTTSPVINGLKDFEYVIGDNIPDFSNSITAIDDVDGDISTSITFDQTEVDFSTPGTYTVTVLVTDSSGNETEATFNVIVTLESIPPVISGAKDFSFQRFSKEVDAFSGISALDNVDGDVTDKIVFDDSLVNYDAPGTYDAFYRVTDAAGNETEIKISVTITGLTDLEIITEEIAFYKENQLINENRLNLNSRGGLHNTLIVWNVEHEMIMRSGIMLNLSYDADPEEVSYTGTFKLNNEEVTETFYITLQPYVGVEIEASRELPFTNLTTEYDVKDGFLDLYFEENGEVPYVYVPDFLKLIEGFIDPSYPITVTETETTLTLFYQYYDEDEDITYDLEVVMDSVANTITTNDPGFYWAYVASTETNFGRHINYVDQEGEHYEEGESIVYELGKYRMDIVESEAGILIPFYIANQLFAGSSYYNVYYNYDGLFGIYSLPDFGTDEFTQIRTSSKNNSVIPDDLIIHNFDMLTFSLDYFYGLRDYLEIDSFYEITMNRASTLLNTTARNFETALRDLLLLYIDEPHTSYGYGSYYNRTTYEGAPANSLDVYGSRFVKWYNDGFIAVDTQIENKWGRVGITSNAWAAGSDSRPYFWFLDDEKTSVVVTLDSFRTSDIEESVDFNVEAIRDVLKLEDISFLPSFEGGNKYFYFKNSTETDNILEVLVKGLDSTYVEIYKLALLDAGYTYIKENDVNVNKADGYYTIIENEVAYMVQVGYNSMFELFYVSVTNTVPETYASEWVVEKDIEQLVLSDSAVYMEEVLENAKMAAPNLENIMLDITWNTGGNVGALYRVVGFITGEPFLVSRISGDTGSKSSSYVQIDGVPKYDMYNWALLTSPLSFSAANSLATIFKFNELGTIIGLRTGGGASSITPILLPVGSAFTMSSNSVSAFRLGLGTEEDPYVYFDNEFGIEPNIIININQLLDNETLLSAFD